MATALDIFGDSDSEEEFIGFSREDVAIFDHMNKNGDDDEIDLASQTILKVKEMNLMVIKKVQLLLSTGITIPVKCKCQDSRSMLVRPDNFLAMQRPFNFSCCCLQPNL